MSESERKRERERILHDVVILYLASVLGRVHKYVQKYGSYVLLSR